MGRVDRADVVAGGERRDERRADAAARPDDRDAQGFAARGRVQRVAFQAAVNPFSEMSLVTSP